MSLLDVPSIRAVAALDDGSRRSIYAFVTGAGRPVTRQQVAHAVGISRKLAAFHLDKLVAVGLLVARTDTARKVRVRGRSPKLYQRSSLDVTVTLPARHPDVLAEMLAEAVTTGGGDQTVREAAMRVARRRGRDLGQDARARAPRGRLGAERALTVSETALDRLGYEPMRETPVALRLRNCPYRPVALEAPELVCHMNQHLLDGFLEGLGADTVHALRRPRDGECCVELRGEQHRRVGPPPGDVHAQQS